MAFRGSCRLRHTRTITANSGSVTGRRHSILYTGIPISRTRLRRCLGEAVWKRLAGLDVLECDCGAGRFTEVLLDDGARVTSVDLSEAVDANAENFC